MKKHYKISLSNLSRGSVPFYLTKLKTPFITKRLFILLSVVFFSLATFAQVNLEEGLVAYYPFNGNANDESGNGNDGVVNGATLTVDRFGNAGNAYEFDGVDDFIDFIGSPTSNVDNFSISCWINPSVLNQLRGTAVLMGVDGLVGGNPSLNGVSICVGGGSFGAVDSRINGAVSDVQMLPSSYYISTINTWYHVIFLRENAVYKLYVDKSLALNTSGGAPNIPTELKIGSASGDGFFKGTIDDIRIYDRALTEAEIQELYNEDFTNYFVNETQNLDDNLVPENWNLNVLIPTAGLYNGRFEAHVTDADAHLERSGQLPEETNMLILEWDGIVNYSYWNQNTAATVCMGAKRFGFHSGMDQSYYGGSIYSIGYSDPETGAMILVQSIQPFAYVENHYRVEIYKDSLSFLATDLTTGAELFLLTTPIPESIPFEFSEVSKIAYHVHTTTNNNTWLDNIKITIDGGIEPNLSLTGSIVEEANGQAIEGASIEITNIATGTSYNTQSNSQGSYQYVNLPTGSYNVQASKMGFQTQTAENVVVDNEETVQLNFELNYVLTLSGLINDAQTSLPIQGAEVLLAGSNSNDQTTSDESGFYGFTELAAGSYNISVIKAGYQTQNRMLYLSEPMTYQENFDLVLLSENSLVINESLVAYADEISEGPTGYYILSGTVNINGILFFDGEVKIDKRAGVQDVIISGNDDIYAQTLMATYPINDLYLPWSFSIHDELLIVNKDAYFFEMPVLVAGFPLTLNAIEVGEKPSGEKFVSTKVIPEFPFPLNEVANFYKKPDELSEFTFAITYDDSGEHIDDVNILIENYNYTLFQINKLHIQYEYAKGMFEGTIILQIPGGKKKKGADDMGELLDIMQMPVVLSDSTGGNQGTISFGELLEIDGDKKKKTPLVIELGIGFIDGKIDKLYADVSGISVPLPVAGMKLTRINGGVYDLTQDQITLEAGVDIETGFKIPSIDKTPILMKDFKVTIKPWDYFEGVGTLMILHRPLAGGYIEYKKNENLALGGFFESPLIRGKADLNISKRVLSGNAELKISTPPEDQIKNSAFKWLGGIEVGTFMTDFKFDGIQKNYYITATIERDLNYLFGEKTFAFTQRFSYDDKSPYFHLAIGLNHGDLHHIFKGQKDGKEAIEFQVPENTPQMMIVAEDTINPQLFDFALQNPSGQLFDLNNTSYAQYENVHQTVMIIDQPMPGDWFFLTDYLGDIALYTQGMNQEPTAYTVEPQNRRTRSNTISLNFTDYADTLEVEVYFDDDNKNYNGTFIDRFTLVNNGSLEFVWQNNDIENGEYFIYSRVDDKKNKAVIQYAPGSIMVMNDPYTEIPQNLSAVQGGDSVLVSWNRPELPETIATAIYWKNISTGKVDQLSLIDAEQTILHNLDYGQEYQLWACFINDNGTYSEPSNKVNLIFASQLRNNPPYFTLDPDSAFVFVVDQQMEYTLKANDADGNTLTFDIPNDTLGITLDGDVMTWTPSDDQKGVYNLMLTVTDGSAVDTSYQELLVYTQHQVSVDLAFSSVNLYEDDNMFVKISNYFCPDYYQQATLRNIRTQDEVQVECRRVNDFEFIGQFGLSFITRSEIPVANGDTIELKYNDGKEEYLTYAYYDSLPQPSDQTPPGAITDLQLEKLSNNQLKLKWTATGNNDTQGKAYKYDIRYAYQPINAEDVYFTAFLIEDFPYPSVSGVTDSLIFDMALLSNIEGYDTVYFSIKAEDEMQNRGALSNSPGVQCLLSPQNLQAEIGDVYFVNLDWDGPTKGMSNFEYYTLYRKYKQGLFYKIATGLENADFDDNLKNKPDGQYQYAVQAIYETGVSDTVYSDLITMDRFKNVSILCSLEDSTNYQGISFAMQGLDTVYAQSFVKTTNMTGLVLLAKVFKTEYAVTISLDGFDTVIDTIEITNQQSVFDYELLHSLRITNLDIPQGWSGISSSVTPENDNIETLTNSIVDELIILQNDNGMYWPGQNVNTLGNWNMEQGYKIKVAENVNMTISGNRLTNQNLSMDESWNLMPVLSECPADVADLFDGKDVSIVKEVAGWRVYWPEFGINTLGELQPGKAYFALMGSEEELEFPECDTPSNSPLRGRTGTIQNEATGLCGGTPFPFRGRAGDGVYVTAISHNIALPVSANSNSILSAGDIIGVFDISGTCYGLAEWNGANTALTVFGNDPLTAEKDGFDQGETMVFKLFRMEDESEIMLDVAYNYSMPQTDAFAENGLSAIRNFKIGNTGITNTGQVQQSQIVPNPAHDAFTLMLDAEPQSEGTLELYNLKGQLMKKVVIDAKSTKVNIEDLPAGVYVVNISIDNQRMVKQLIKH